MLLLVLVLTALESAMVLKDICYNSMLPKFNYHHHCWMKFRVCVQIDSASFFYDPFHSNDRLAKNVLHLMSVCLSKEKDCYQ